MFDLVFSFSSVEHSGLGEELLLMLMFVTIGNATMHSAGRYGDPLNPWADIITVAETWCVSSPDVSGTCAIGIFPSVQARLVLGVPTDVERQDGSAGQDLVHFNAHRCHFSMGN